MEMTDMLRVIVIMQLFFSFGITSISYAIPDDAKIYVDSFGDLNSNVDMESINEEIQDSLNRQTNIPVIELGALVFYSGNILLDLFLNFAFAIPQIVTMIMQGIMLLLSIDTGVIYFFQIFLTISIAVIYLIGIIQMLTNIRSGRVI